MRKFLGVFVLALGFIIAACGGTAPSGGNGNNGNGGGGGGGGDVTVTVTTVTGTPTAAAYRVGDGDWQVASDPASFSFVVGDGGNYDVAMLCGFGDLRILSFTADELATPKVYCGLSSNIATFDVDYDASDITNASAVRLYHKNTDYEGTEETLNTSKIGTIKETDGLAGMQDLVMLAVDNNDPPQVLAAELISVDVANNGHYAMHKFKNDPIETANFPDFGAEVPNGYTPYWVAVAVTPLGTLAYSGYGKNAGGAGNIYYIYSFATHKWFLVGASSQNSSIYTIYSSSLDTTPTISLSNPINPTVSGSTPLKFDGLSTSPDLSIYHINIFHTSFASIIYVSKAYLENSSSYEMPELTGVSGFENMSYPSGANLIIDISEYKTNINISTFIDILNTSFNQIAIGKYIKYSNKRIEYTMP